MTMTGKAGGGSSKVETLRLDGKLEKWLTASAKSEAPVRKSNEVSPGKGEKSVGRKRAPGPCPKRGFLHQWGRPLLAQLNQADPPISFPRLHAEHDTSLTSNSTSCRNGWRGRTSLSCISDLVHVGGNAKSVADCYGGTRRHQQRESETQWY